MVVNNFQSLNIITKCSIFDVATSLDPPLQIGPINPPWFKQLSKGRFYQFNCHFQLQIGHITSQDIFRFIFRQLRMTFFHKIILYFILYVFS